MRKVGYQQSPHPPAIPPPDGCEQHATALVRRSLVKTIPFLETRRLQQQATGRSAPREGRAVPPLHSIAGVRRGPSESCDGHSMRPKSSPRQRSPGPADWDNATTQLPPLLAILGRRQRAAYPPPGVPELPPAAEVQLCRRHPNPAVLRTSCRIIIWPRPSPGAARGGEGVTLSEILSSVLAQGDQIKKAGAKVPVVNTPGGDGRKQSAAHGTCHPLKPARGKGLGPQTNRTIGRGEETNELIGRAFAKERGGMACSRGRGGVRVSGLGASRRALVY